MLGNLRLRWGTLMYVSSLADEEGAIWLVHRWLAKHVAAATRIVYKSATPIYANPHLAPSDIILYHYDYLSRYYIHINMCTYMYIYIYTYIHTYIHTCVYIYIYINVLADVEGADTRAREALDLQDSS